MGPSFITDAEINVARVAVVIIANPIRYGTGVPAAAATAPSGARLVWRSRTGPAAAKTASARPWPAPQVDSDGDGLSNSDEV